MTTLILDRSQIEQLLDPIALLESLRSAFQTYILERTIAAQRLPALLPGQGNAMILVPGLAAGISAYSVKVHAKFPGQTPRSGEFCCYTIWKRARCWPLWTPLYCSTWIDISRSSTADRYTHREQLLETHQEPTTLPIIKANQTSDPPDNCQKENYYRYKP